MGGIPKDMEHEIVGLGMSFSEQEVKNLKEAIQLHKKDSKENNSDMYSPLAAAFFFLGYVEKNVDFMDFGSKVGQ